MLEKNLQGIARYNPELAEKIRNHKVIGQYSFEVAQSGDYVLCYENLPFHSLDDPQKEALDTFNNLNDINRSTITLVFGIGLGYLFKRVYMNSPGRIFLYEPNLDILRITLESVDFSGELADDRVFILTNKEALEPAFSKYFLYNDPVNMCFSNIYRSIYPALIDEISYELSFLKGYYNNNYYTLFELAKEWTEMSLKNFNHIMNSEYIDCLSGKLSGVPAVITAAGPSLLNNIDQLKEYENRVAVFTVGAALRLVTQEYNIRPDLSFFIDVTERIGSQLNAVDAIDDLNFVMQPYTFSEIFEAKPKRKFVYLPSNDAFSNWIAGKLKLKIGSYVNRGTVALSAVYTALNLGCNPIILLGQDLAFTPEGLNYADEKITSYHEKEDLKVEGWNGEQLPTNSSFLMFKRYFENLAAEVKNKVRLINCSESGAVINGFEHMTFKEASKLFPESHINFEAIIEEATGNYINPLKAGKLTAINALKNSSSAINKLNTITKNALIVISKTENELNKPHINKKIIIKNLKQVYDYNGRTDRILLNECPLLSTMIQKAIMACQQGFARHKAMKDLEDYKNYLELSRGYYEAIQEQGPLLNSWLEDVLKVKKS